MKKLFIGSFMFGLVAFGLSTVSFATGNVNTGSTNTGTNSTGIVNTGTTNTGTATGTTSTGTVSTGATGLNCRDLTVSTSATITSNIRVINTNWTNIRKKYPKRRPSMIVKNKKQETKKLNSLNLKTIDTLHKEFAQKHLVSSTGVTVNEYVEKMVAQRAKFFSGIVQRAATGSQSGLNVFTSDYLKMFRENRTLRLQNVVLRHQLWDKCHGKKPETLLKSLHKLFEKYLKQEQRTTEIHQKRLDDLHKKINKLKTRFGENSDMHRALEHFERDIEEARDDNEPRD